MEHREPPRIGPGDRDRPIDGTTTQHVAGPFRLRRFDEAADGRRIDYARFGLLLCVGLALMAGLFWGWRASHNWLATQPQYQLPFNQIQLVDDEGRPDEPPSWYRGGSHSFLDNVRNDSREPGAISVLEVTADRLSQVFKNYAWVKDVVRVVYGPGSVRIQLRYRQPVAWIQLRDGDQIVVDEEGTILPAKDIDVAALGRVIKLIGDIAPPTNLRYGVKWKSLQDGSNVESIDERILAAARLAAFLVRADQARDAERSAALRMSRIIVSDFHRRGLFTLNAEDSTICWGDAPGINPSESLNADEKWAMLRRWADTTAARFLVEGDYWALSKDGVHFACGHPKARHRPSLSSNRGSSKPDVH